MNTPISNPIPRPSTTSYLGSSSPRLPSPSETPPSSPRSPTLGPTSGGGSAPEQCRNCTMTLPKKFEEELSPSSSTGRGVSPPGRPLRTTETVLVGAPAGAKGDVERVGRSQPQSSPKFQISSATPSLATHTHTVTYLSSRSPAQASRYSNVRQACIRSLSCELVPAQTGPILFGDGHTGYTIAVVFKLSDSKSRGGLRTYALLCMSMNQKALVQSWNVVALVFQNLVHEIQHAVAEKAAKDAQTSPSVGASMSSVGSRGPESFLRRRAPGDGASQKSLADLVGKDRFFVDLHSAFVRLLAGLSKIYGYGSATHEITADMMPLSIGSASSPGGRSRAGSVGSACEDRDKRQQHHQASPATSASQASIDPATPNIKTQPPTFDRIPEVTTRPVSPLPPPADARASATAASNATAAASLSIPRDPASVAVAASAKQQEEQVPRNLESRPEVATAVGY